MNKVIFVIIYLLTIIITFISIRLYDRVINIKVIKSYDLIKPEIEVNGSDTIYIYRSYDI